MALAVGGHQGTQIVQPAQRRSKVCVEVYNDAKISSRGPVRRSIELAVVQVVPGVISGATLACAWQKAGSRPVGSPLVSSLLEAPLLSGHQLRREQERPLEMN
jgi:hypothetical protein